jgi:dTDP-4-dehydrorhamnose reductase
MRIIVLGASGMLGQAVKKECLAAGQEVLAVSRTSEYHWDFAGGGFAALASDLGLSQEDVLVNCIGWIPQKSSGSLDQDNRDAQALNVDLIAEIQASQDAIGFGWVQIVTDCVFSGENGPYSEQSVMDPVDLYGQTKSLGESLMSGAMRIRSSIIGPDRNHHSGLYEWFKNQKADAAVQGFVNHLWNGVSTKAFGRLVAGLTTQRKVLPGLQHWIPRDSASKHGLLEIFKSELDRRDISLAKYDTGSSANRVLVTANPELNLELWGIAGYDRIPSIEELAREFILEDLKVGN